MLGLVPPFPSVRPSRWKLRYPNQTSHGGLCRSRNALFDDNKQGLRLSLPHTPPNLFEYPKSFFPIDDIENRAKSARSIFSTFQAPIDAFDVFSIPSLCWQDLPTPHCLKKVHNKGWQKAPTQETSYRIKKTGNIPY